MHSISILYLNNITSQAFDMHSADRVHTVWISKGAAASATTSGSASEESSAEEKAKASWSTPWPWWDTWQQRWSFSMQSC